LGLHAQFAHEEDRRQQYDFPSQKSPGHHYPRIEIVIDPPDSFDANRRHNVVMVLDDEYTVIGARLPSAVRNQAIRFIELNRKTIEEYWNLQIDDEEMRDRILPIER
jgi:hypothetical protein